MARADGATFTPVATPAAAAPRVATPTEAPPAGLVAEHFAAALAFFACGAVGLVIVAPDLAAGVFYLPRVAAVVHLFTLGWIIPSIFGALCQFLPVAVGRPMRSTAAAHVSFGAQVLGAASFVVALATGTHALLHVGACLLAVAFVVFAANLAATLAAVHERSLTWFALAGACVFLVVTPAYGLLLALNLTGLTGEGLVTDRFATVAAHAHIAIIGVVLLVMTGVAHRLLPMFLLSHGASERAARVSLVLLFACAAMLAVPMGQPAHEATARVAGALGCGGVLAFVVQAATFFRHRRRRAIDPGMRLAAAGVAGLLVAALLAPFALSRGLSDLHLLATYFVVLLGALALFVAGHYYKIVPFLVWNHRFASLVGVRKVPKVADLYSARVALVNGILLVAGLAGLAVATYVGSAAFARAFAVVFAAGAALEVVVMVRIARTAGMAPSAPVGREAPTAPRKPMTQGRVA